MHEVDHRSGLVDVGLLQHPMTQVEDVPGAACRLLKDVGHPAFQLVAPAQQGDRIEIPLDGALGARQFPGLVEPDPPVHSDDVWTGLGQQRNQCRVACGEIDDRGALDLPHDLSDVRQDIPPVVVGTQAARPRIEQLDGLGSGLNLGR